MAQKWNTGTGKSKTISTKSGMPSTKTAPLSAFASNKSGNPNGNKRQSLPTAPSGTGASTGTGGGTGGTGGSGA